MINENANTCNGYYNKDTYLVAMWLENDLENYLRLQILCDNTNNLEDINNTELLEELKSYRYEDTINFNKVATEEIRQAILDC